MQRFEFDLRSRRVKSCTQKATLMEKILTGIVILLAVIIIIFIAYTVLSHEIPVCQTKACIETAVHLLNSIDKSVNPCDNFYNFACGNFMKDALLKDTTSIKQTLKELSWRRDKYFYLDAKDPSHGMQVQLKYFKACMNEAAIEEDDNASFLSVIEQLGGWPLIKHREWLKSGFSYIEAMKISRHLGISGEWLLEFDIFQVYNSDETNMLEINAPLRSVHNITDESAYAEAILDVRDVLANNSYNPMFRSTSDTQECEEMVRFENALFKLCQKAASRANVSPYSLDDLKSIFPYVQWNDLLSNITKRKYTDDDKVIFHNKQYFADLTKLLQDTDERTQANYIIWKTIEYTAPFLSKRVRRLVESSRQFIDEGIVAEENRFDFCNREVSDRFNNDKSASLLRKYLTKAKREDIAKIIKAIKGQYERKILGTSWMDEKTKVAAVSKIHNINVVIGGPEEMYDENEFNKFTGIDKINLRSDNLIDILREVYAKNHDHAYSKLSTYTDRWKMVVYSLISSANPRFMEDLNNTLFLPAVLFHNEYHNEDRPNYLNYGSIGHIIAHEFTHALYKFYLADPATRNATVREKDAFTGRINCLLHNCNAVQANVQRWKTMEADRLEMSNCSNTILEDFADHTGIEIAHKAYQALSKQYGRELRLNGLKYTQKQLFWIINASLMCYKIIPDVRTVINMAHQPPPLRLLTYVRNSPSFKSDFHCVEDAHMNPGQKCEVF